MLDIYQIKNGKFQKNEQLVNIREPLQLIYEMFKIGVEEKGLDFFLKFEESIPKTQILVD